MRCRFFLSILILIILFSGTIVFADDENDFGREETVLEKSSEEKNLLLLSDAGWKNYFTVGTEIVVTNLVVYNFCTLILNQSWKKTNPEIMWKNLTSPWLWDTSHFLKNQGAHPYFGNMYFTSARSNGLNFWQSMLMTMAGSFLWENCIEAGNNSLNDFITTSFAGSVVGEVFYRLGNEGAKINPWLGALFNPVGAINSIFTGRKLGTDESHIHSLRFDLGGGMIVDKISSSDFVCKRYAPELFFNAEVVYQNPYGHSTKEFMDQFSAGVGGEISANGYFLRADFDGEFFSVPLYLNQNAESNVGCSFNYDGFYGDSGFLSLNSLGAFFKQKINFGENFFAYGGECDFVFFGVTDNSYIDSKKIVDPWDSTYTFGPQLKLFAEYSSTVAGDFYFGGQCEYLASYGNTPGGKKLSGNFFIFDLDAGYRHKIYKNLGLGVSAEYLKKIRTDAGSGNFGRDFFTASLFVEYGF